jgi:hypothetical protein
MSFELPPDDAADNQSPVLEFFEIGEPSPLMSLAEIVSSITTETHELIGSLRTHEEPAQLTETFRFETNNTYVTDLPEIVENYQMTHDLKGCDLVMIKHDDVKEIGLTFDFDDGGSILIARSSVESSGFEADVFQPAGMSAEPMTLRRTPDDELRRFLVVTAIPEVRGAGGIEYLDILNPRRNHFEELSSALHVRAHDSYSQAVYEFEDGSYIEYSEENGVISSIRFARALGKPDTWTTIDINYGSDVKIAQYDKTGDVTVFKPFDSADAAASIELIREIQNGIDNPELLSTDAVDLWQTGMRHAAEKAPELEPGDDEDETF